MTMNTVQMKYARERAKNIFEGKKLKLREKHTIPAIKLTYEQVIEALNKGEFKVLTNCPSSRVNMYYLKDYIAFNGEKDEYFNQQTYNTELADLTEKFNKLTDEIILGDCEKALNLLKDFSDA